MSYRNRFTLIFQQVETTRLFFCNLKLGFMEGPSQSPQEQGVTADKNGDLT